MAKKKLPPHKRLARSYKRLRKQAGFFIPPGYIIVAALLIVIVGAGVFIYKNNHKPAPTLGAGTTIKPTDDAAAKIKNFYDCFETDGRTYKAGTPNTCTAHGKQFAEPTDFTTDNVRAADTLPAGVRGQVFSDAATNFGECGVGDNQDEARVPVTQVLSVLGNDWTYIGLSCESSTTEIFARQPDGSWLMVDQTSSKILCSTADKYQIPKELFLRSVNIEDHDTACVKADNTVAQIPYTWTPSPVTSDSEEEPQND